MTDIRGGFAFSGSLMEKQKKLSSTAFNNHQKLDISWHNPRLKRTLTEYLQAILKRSKLEHY